MKLGLINSAWLGTPVGTAQGIQLTKDIGFDCIDLFVDPLDTSPQQLRIIQESCDAAEIPVSSTVCCALGIADFNPPVRRFHIDRAKRFLDLCYLLNGKNLLLVVGEYVWNREVIKPEDQWHWAVDGTRELGDYAQPLGLEIAIELEPFELSIVNTVDKMDSFLDQVARPNVKANIDISHLALAKDAPAQIAKLAGRIGHAHLSDCDGLKHGDLPPGRGVVDFPPYLKALADAGFSGTISIELEYSPEPERIVEWVREAYQTSSTMMNALRIRS